MERPDEKLFVENIKEGWPVEAVFLVDDIRLGTTKNGKPYAGLKLKDRTGALEARVWDGAELFCRTFKNGDPVLITGLAESFQGQVQVKVTGAKSVPPDRVDPALFIKSTPHDVEELYAEMREFINGMSDPHLRGLMQDFFDDADFASEFKRAPAAKNFHHAYAGGLLEHTVCVVRAANAISRLYPVLNRDLLLAGAMLHDVGKTIEFDQGFTGDYTDEGRLLGHLVIGVGMLDDRLAERPDFPPALALMLKHLIVSHHGEYEMGSPKKPKFMEAIVLNMIDDLDAKMNGIGGFIENRADEKTGWTDYNRLMERYFFLPKYNWNDFGAQAEDASTPKPKASRPRPRKKPPETKPAAAEKTEATARQDDDQPLLWGD